MTIYRRSGGRRYEEPDEPLTIDAEVNLQEMPTRQVQDFLRDSQFRLMVTTDVAERNAIRGDVSAAATELLRRYRSEDVWVSGVDDNARDGTAA